MMVICAIALLSSTALADPPPKDKLKETEAVLEETRAKEKTLAGQAEEGQRALSSLKSELVELTQEVQKGEKLLSESEGKLAILQQEEREKAVLLEQRQKELSAMMAAAIRLSKTPPEAAVMMPGDFSDTMKAARVLSTLTRTIREEAKAIGAEARELKNLRTRVEQSMIQTAQRQKQLKEQQRELDGLVRERGDLVARLEREHRETRAQVVQLTKQAKNLRDLVESLEKSRGEKERQARADAPRPGNAKAILRMPVMGDVIRRFGDALGKNGTSKGMAINARENARVVAPSGGEVVFSGPFLDYGRMVILRHRSDFHTLLAGLHTINVKVGDFLLEGEPIGAMGNSAPDRELYLELRERNQPVDPRPWMKE